MQTFLFTINSFREPNGRRWLVWLIIYGYFRHGATTSTLDLLSRTMVILLLLLWLLLRLLQLVTWFERKTNFFLFGTRHFHLLTKVSQKWFVDYKSYLLYKTKFKENVFYLFHIYLHIWMLITSVVVCARVFLFLFS